MEKLLKYLPWRLLMSVFAFYSGYDGISLGVENHRTAVVLNAAGMLLVGVFWFLQPAVLSLAVFRAPFYDGMQLISQQSRPAVIAPAWLRATIMLSALVCCSVGLVVRTIDFLA